MNDKTIDNLIDEIAQNTPNFTEDQNQKNAPSKQEERRGRKNKGITEKSRREYIEEYAREKRTFRHIEQPQNFVPEIVERVKGEVIEGENIEEFKELYKLTCESILEEYKANNEELVKKHPYNWYKPLLIEIKKNVPKVGAEEVEKLTAIWDCLAELLFFIGLYPTFETFQYMTNVYKYQLEERQKLNPKYADLLKKIRIESENALVNEIATNPYNQTNKIFLAKVHGIIEKTEPKTIEVNHHIENFESISAYRLTEKE